MIATINVLIDISLLFMLVVTALMIIRNQSPLAVVILAGIYSLSICTLFVILDAVDVAFTEAAVGAGISTVLFLAVTRPQDEPGQQYQWPSAGAVAIAVFMGVLLVFGTLDMPWYGDPSAPVHQHIAPRYLNQSGTEIGIPNVVTSVLASYRGYDTLGEVVVIFTAGISVFILLANDHQDKRERPASKGYRELVENSIFKVILIRIIPLVLLFALYVQFHGDYGPGGGFQAGVIFGAGLITFGLLTNSEKMQRVISEKSVLRGMATGVLIYGLTGVAALFAGGEFLNYSVLAASPTAGQHIGILLIELGVGLTVACTMIALFISFSRSRGDGD